MIILDPWARRAPARNLKLKGGGGIYYRRASLADTGGAGQDFMILSSHRPLGRGICESTETMET
mgnify:CR=1 FL=1